MPYKNLEEGKKYRKEYYWKNIVRIKKRDKKCYWSHKKPCPDCGKMISSASKKCHSCSMMGNKSCIGRILSKKTRKKMSESLLGNKRNLGKCQNQSTKDKISFVLKNYYNQEGVSGWAKGGKWSKTQRIKLSGENSHFWKGGITPLAIMIRALPEYFEWRSEVFQRDNWTCQICGKKGGCIKIEAHHKKSFFKIFAEFLREYNQFSPYDDKDTLVRLAMNYKPFWNTNNGLTVCLDCHMDIDNRRWKKRNEKGQFSKL